MTPTASLLGDDTWQLQALGAGSALAVAMAFNGAQEFTVDGIFVTSDGGATWQRPTGPFRHLTAYTVTALDARHLWAWRLGPNRSLQLEATAGGGSHWAAVAAQGLPAAGAVDQLAFTSATLGWAIGAGGAGVGPWPWLAVTRDGGRIWTRVPLPPVHDGASVETGAPAVLPAGRLPPSTSRKSGTTSRMGLALERGSGPLGRHRRGCVDACADDGQVLIYRVRTPERRRQRRSDKDGTATARTISGAVNHSDGRVAHGVDDRPTPVTGRDGTTTRRTANTGGPGGEGAALLHHEALATANRSRGRCGSYATTGSGQVRC